VISLPQFALVLVIAALVSGALNWLLVPLLSRYAMAAPNARSSHKVATPQGGGFAVVAALFVAAAVTAAFPASGAAGAVSLWPLAIAVLLLAATGACDDVFQVPVGPRLAVQLVAVAVVLAELPDGARVLPFLPWWVERTALLVAGVYFVNVVNFMDGIDWITVAEVVPVTAALAAASLLGALAPTEGAVATALLGAVLGFAPFNRPVAKLFLGDVGSLPIGIILFWLLLRLAANGHVAAALLLPLYYLADATITLARRVARRENVLRAHRTHFYQRATDLGFSVADVVGRVFALNVALAVLAVASVSLSSPPASAAALAAGGTLVTALLVHFTRGRPRIAAR
jgi:UDP-N-acetylmuramyl pentapeptide phosphotransferase/UDP-N-acetylglucosamine-1-phosphate transferase